MSSVSVTEFSENFGRYREAVQREPGALVSDGRTSGYFIAPAEFDIYERMKGLARTSYTIEDLPEDILEAIGRSRMDPEHDHLNSLLDGR